MKFSLEDLALIYSDQLFLKFSEVQRERAWQQTQNYSYSNPAARWNAYLNYLCLHTFLDYLKTELELQVDPKVLPERDNLSSFWQLVNGMAIDLDYTRLVLIPSDASDLIELRVQREWLEIPNWTGNYYLALQIDLEENYLRILGYANHQQLYQSARRDSLDETYSIDIEELTEDLTAMWVAQELYPSPKPSLEPLPTLSAEGAEALLQKLSQPLPYSPRLEVPFDQWATLIANEQWRKELYQRQQQNYQLLARDTTQSTEDASTTPANIASEIVSNDLGSWFGQVFHNGWQSIETLFGQESNGLALSYGFRQSPLKTRNFSVEGVKVINLGMELGDRSVALLIGLMPETENKVGIRIQMHPTNGNKYLPAQIKLALLSQSDRVLQEVLARDRDSAIQLKRFFCPRGKSFRIEITLEQFSLTEDFVVTL